MFMKMALLRRKNILNKKIYRHEQKYIISYSEKEQLEKKLASVMNIDRYVKNGKSYTIRSLYFDDMWRAAYDEKLMGINSRKKFRIRIYDFSSDIIRLERKRKIGSYIKKDSAVLSLEEYNKIIEGDFEFLFYRKEEICREFYFECIANKIRPAVIVDYERIPYVYPYGDVRITFDSGVRAGIFLQDIFSDNLPTFDAMESGKLILEVKFTEFLPNVIKDLLQIENSEYTSMSKYVMCMEKVMQK